MDVEQALRRHIEAETGEPAYFEAPADFPARFCTVGFAGGSESERGTLASALMPVKCWARTRPEARALYDTARGAVESFPDEGDVTACRVESAFRDRDPDSGWARYQMTVSVEYMQ